MKIIKPRLIVYSVLIALAASVPQLGFTGAYNGACPSPMPTCKVWGTFIASYNPLCCEETTTSCRDMSGEEWTCATGSANHYKNLTWGSWYGGMNCNSTNVGCY